MLTYKRPVDWFSVGAQDIDYRFGVQGVIVPLHQSPGLEHTIYHNALTRVSQFACSPGGSYSHDDVKNIIYKIIQCYNNGP